MHITVTGTRRGMTHAQRKFMQDVLGEVTLLVHGGCHGVDQQVHDLYYRPRDTEVYPSTPEQHAKFSSLSLRYLSPVIEPLARNRMMVERTPILYAMPKGFVEEPRGGTWATIRYAQKKNRYYIVVWPDGIVTVNSSWHPH